ncbi:MAG: nucleoside deaminase [Proteobacteria bacterium]|nr:nucleoside deaminase [Pseudomonadota bacterium]
MDDEHYMQIALGLAEKALAAGEFPVGCVLVCQGRVIADGARVGTKGDFINEVDHAEMVALRRLIDLKENIDKREITLFCTMEPCLMCLGALILNGVGRIVYAYEDVMGGGAGCDLAKLTPLYRDRSISIVPNVLRPQSLALFKTFFRSPENNYWRGSLLAEYTLSQSPSTNG